MLDKVLQRSSLSPEEQDQIRTLGEMFEEHYHLDYHKGFLELKDAFAPFNPDKKRFMNWSFQKKTRLKSAGFLLTASGIFLR